MNNLRTFLFVLLLGTFAGAQETSNRNFSKRPGVISGKIVIKNVVGNGLSKFQCSNLVASAAKLGGNGWTRKSRANGDFSKRSCYFVLPSIPAGEQFVASLNAQMPSCDQKSFEATTSFPMELKSGESLKYSFEVTKISCVVVK